MRPALLACVVSSLLLAGCVTPPAAPEGPGGTGTPAAPLAVALDPVDCQLGLLILFVGLDQAQSSLPEGFTARDAQGVLGAPAPLGKGAVLVGNLDCAQSALDAPYTLAELLVFVETPAVDAELAASTADYYAPGVHAGPGPLADLVAQAGWASLGTDAAVDVSLGPVASTAAGFLRDDGAVVWDYAIAGASTQTFSALERIWHETPDGLSFIENEYTNDGILGAAECDLGGVAAEVVGATSCAPGSAIGAVVPPQSWNARLVTLPGVHAT